MRDIIGILPAYKNSRVKVVENQNTSDIMRLINTAHEATKKDYDKISEKFWKGNARETARYLFDFLKRNVEYDIEPGKAQTVKTPSAILNERHGDCKHYAGFIVGVVDSLNRKGYPVSGGYMYINSHDNSTNYHHVFGVVTDTETGREYYTDPIYNRFDIRKPVNKSKFVPMALYMVSGESSAVGAAVGKKTKEQKAAKKANRQANKQARKENRQARKAERKAIRALPKEQRKAVRKEKRVAKRAARKEDRKGLNFVQKTAHVVMKVPNAISRGALCTLLKINAFRMASKIAKKAAEDPNWKAELKKQWLVAGGTWKPFVQAVNQGVNVYNAKFADKVQPISGDYVPLNVLPSLAMWQRAMCNCQNVDDIEDEADAIGADPYTWASIAAVVAAAVPLIMKLMGLFKKAGVNEDELNEAGFEAYDEVTDEYNDGQQYPVDEDDYIDSENDTPQFGIKAYNRASDGLQTIEYTKSNINENGDVDYSPANSNLNMTLDRVKDWVIDNKAPLMWAGGGLLAIRFLPDIIRSISPKKRRR